MHACLCLSVFVCEWSGFAWVCARVRVPSMLSITHHKVFQRLLLRRRTLLGVHEDLTTSAPASAIDRPCDMYTECDRSRSAPSRLSRITSGRESRSAAEAHSAAVARAHLLDRAVGVGVHKHLVHLSRATATRDGVRRWEGSILVLAQTWKGRAGADAAGASSPIRLQMRRGEPI